MEKEALDKEIEEKKLAIEKGNSELNGRISDLES